VLYHTKLALTALRVLECIVILSQVEYGMLVCIPVNELMSFVHKTCKQCRCGIS